MVENMEAWGVFALQQQAGRVFYGYSSPSCDDRFHRRGILEGTADKNGRPPNLFAVMLFQSAVAQLVDKSGAVYSDRL